MIAQGKRVQTRQTGKRVRKQSILKDRTGVGWLCRTLAAAFVLLLCLSIWQYVSYTLENRREEQFMAGLQAHAVTARERPSPLLEEPLPEPELPPIEVDFALLQEENPDIIAWIYCPDTEVNYPVLQSEDNRYYLRRGSDGSYRVAGSIFADCRNASDLSDENVILYGHNMTNGGMFALLPHYAQQEFYEEHPVWYLLTPTANYKAELFAGFVTSTKSLVYSTVQEEADDRPIMVKAWEDSDFRGGPPPEEGERTITLSTCSYEFSDARYVVVGILRELGGS